MSCLLEDGWMGLALISVGVFFLNTFHIPDIGFVVGAVGCRSGEARTDRCDAV
jgi:hypothetical protein